MLHKTKPKNFNPRFYVVGCFVEYEKQILLLFRNESKAQWHTWCMPWWKKDEWESIKEAMQRELEEETG